jgi:hypothetical protein
MPKKCPRNSVERMQKKKGNKEQWERKRAIRNSEKQRRKVTESGNFKKINGDRTPGCRQQADCREIRGRNSVGIIQK